MLIDPLKDLSNTISIAEQEVSRCGSRLDAVSQANQIVIILAKALQEKEARIKAVEDVTRCIIEEYDDDCFKEGATYPVAEMQDDLSKILEAIITQEDKT